MTGRFMSVDPENAQAMAGLDDPQSWNAYAYVNNNPLSRIDPNGKLFIASDLLQDLKEIWHNWKTYGYAMTDAELQRAATHARTQIAVEFQIRDAKGEIHSIDTSSLPAGAVLVLRDQLVEARNNGQIEVAANVPPGRPALNDDPYHEKNVQDRKKDLEKLKKVMQSDQRAAERVGYNNEVKDPPFNSHGQKVFTNGKNYITRDIDQHRGGFWKMFDRSGKRLGTYDVTLTRRIGG